MGVFRIERAQQRAGETVEQADHGGLQELVAHPIASSAALRTLRASPERNRT
jgi:hypothetical protein